MTGNPSSTLATAADVHLNVSVNEEACPLNLAPTASTTATLAMGDALAVALLESRGFTAEDFALSHPSGSLGKRLILRVSDVMHAGDKVPAVSEQVSLSEGLMEMTRKGLGMTAVIDDDYRVLGIFTDGDLRRTLDAGIDVHKTTMKSVMHRGSKTTGPDILAAEAVHVMEENKITGLLVVDDDDRLVGALNVHDLFRAGVM
jgi:arabinose-5-phosphate isomerase